MNPYIQFMQPQDTQGLAPVFQNIASQQANQNAALQQQMQNNQMAGQTQGSMGGLNPLAMAAMLRGKKPEMMGNGQTPNWQNPYANYDSGATMGSSGIE